MSTLNAAAVTAGDDAVTDATFAELEEAAAKKKKLGIGAWLAIIWLGLLAFVSLFAGFLPLNDPDASVDVQRLAPFQNMSTPLGTDANGRDLLARAIYGARVSMLIAVCAVFLGLIVGGLLGLVAGYFRNWIGNALASFFDILLAIPQLVLALAMVSVLKGDPSSTEGFHLPVVLVLILTLGLVSIPILARITRASTFTWSQREFVTAARAQGAGDARILLREVLPNVLPAMVSISLLGIAVAIVAEGGLALLGASVEPPQSTWGTMVAAGRSDLELAPFILFVPVIAIFLTVLSLNYLGDVVRDRFDVRESAL